jgi:hypothetical protein
LPIDYQTSMQPSPSPETDNAAMVGKLYARHEGGLISRALGTAVHALLEEFAHLRVSLTTEQSREALALRPPRIAAQIRSTGVDPTQASKIAEEALKQALSAANDAVGAWILSPHKHAGSEVHWTGMIAGGLRSVRIDRLFQAGAAPEAEGESFWWIIDYKTAHAPTEDHSETLAELRPLFAPQLTAYATVLRGMHGADAQIRAGLYYPRMGEFDWWEL